MKAEAIVFHDVGKVELRDFELRRPRVGEVLVRARWTCVSPGTELRCLAGKQPGGASFPFVPGYAMVGEVVEAGPESGLQVGDAVYLNGTQDAGALGIMWGGHVSHAIVSASGCLPVPAGADLKQASLAHLAAIALNGVEMANPRPGETVAIIGLGILGQLSGRLFRSRGCLTIGCDRSGARVERARAAGIEAVQVDRGLEALRAVLPDGADVIVDATGNTGVLPVAIALARDVPWQDPVIRGSRYVVQGSYPGSFEVPYQEAFLKELTLLLPRDCRRGQRALVLEEMASGTLQVADLVEEVRRPEEAQQAYNDLTDFARGPLTVVFEW